MARRVIPVSAGALVAALLLSGCATTGRKIAVESRVERLKRDIGKVKFAISTTKTLLARARGAQYVPDLYMRLAELYIEEAKYYYHIAYETAKDKAGGVVSVQTRTLKEQAVATYRRLMAIYPDYRDTDKVLFFMAHEMRELGNFEEMLKTYLDLAEKFQKSEYRLEGLLIVGDYYFDKADLTQAEKYYGMVIDSPETRVHAMARYKLAWCKINQADFKGALSLFEGAVQAARKFLPTSGTQDPSSGGKIDLRREALVDSVYSYTEVHKPKGALEYFKERADSKTTYLAALEKLGNRYYVKQNWQPTAMIYREILSMTGDMEDSLEYAHRLYEAVTNGKVYDHGAADVAALINVIRRRYLSHTLTAKDRNALLSTFEKYTRDIATRLHDLANEKKDEEKYLHAAQAYQAYLGFFGEGKYATVVRSNMAEALYAAKQYLDAGHQYELASEGQKSNEQRESTYTAVVSYFEALKGAQQLTRLQVAQGRAGLRRAGREFVRRYPRDPKMVKVKFNIARTYYDAGEYDDAIRLFTALLDQFPSAEEATVSAHLALDCYRSMEDFEGLIQAGKRFGAMPGLGNAEFKNEVAAIVRGAEDQELGRATIEAADAESGKTGVDKLLDTAAKFKGSNLECRALLNAFVTAKSAVDTDKVLEVGEKLIRSCPTSENLPDVLATMGKLAINAFRFDLGVQYLEAAARRKSGADSIEMFRAACKIRAGLGQRKKAEESLGIYLRSGGDAAAKAELAVSVAELQVEAGDWSGASSLLQKAMAAGATSAQLLYNLGYALYRQGNMPEAEAYLAQAVSAGKAGTADDREAAAAAQFYLAEIAFKAFGSVQLSSDLSQLGPTLQNKLTLMTRTSEAYKGVVALGSGVWSVASLGRLASVDAAGANALRSLALPQGLPPEVAKQVKGALEGNAAPLAKEAQDALKQCGAKALQLTVLSEAARACLAGKAPSADPQGNLTVPSVSWDKPSGAAALERTLNRNPHDFAAISKLAELYLRAGNPYMARMVVGRGLEIKESGALLNLAGVATARLGKHQDALDLFEKALAKEPSNLQARLNKATLLADYGYTKASSAELKKTHGAQRTEGDPRLLPSTRHAE